jgi:spore coat polysaccharide biosynthesis protein SpsF (cytidylyltransferase family)
MTDEKDETNEEHVEFVTDDTPCSQHEGRVSYLKETCEWANSQPILSLVVYDDLEVIQKVMEARADGNDKVVSFTSLHFKELIRGKILNQEVQITTTPALGFSIFYFVIYLFFAFFPLFY